MPLDSPRFFRAGSVSGRRDVYDRRRRAVEGEWGRLTQEAVVASALDTLEQCLNTGGFALVAVSFTFLGILFRRVGDSALSSIAIATGVLTGGGRVPGLEVLFYLANAGFLIWYALDARFRRRRHDPTVGEVTPPVGTMTAG